MNRFRCLVIALVALAGCDRSEPFGPEPQGTATVTVGAFFEYDGQPGQGFGDDPARGLRFQVLLAGSATAIASGVADAAGVIQLVDIPVGTYDFRVDPAYLGDSLIVSQIDTTRATLAPGAALALQVSVTPPSRSVAEAKQLPVGRRVWITGMALNGRGASIDGAIHVYEAGSSAIRVLFPAATDGFASDSVRALGRTVGPAGPQRYLVDGRIAVLARDVRPILPMEVGLNEARSAGGGVLDARLVRIRQGQVVDTASVAFVGLRVTIAIGAEQVTVMLAEQNGFGGQTVPLGLPVVSITGLLVPEPASPGSWRIVPRGQSEAQFGSLPPAP